MRMRRARRLTLGRDSAARAGKPGPAAAGFAERPCDRHERAHLLRRITVFATGVAPHLATRTRKPAPAPAMSGVAMGPIYSHFAPELEAIGWPICTRAIAPRGTHRMFSGRKEELSIDVPIPCGGVHMDPGDFILVELMGVTVIPQDKTEEAVELAREQAEREETTRAWATRGKTVEDLPSDRPTAVEARSAELKSNAPCGQTKILADVQ